MLALSPRLALRRLLFLAAVLALVLSPQCQSQWEMEPQVVLTHTASALVAVGLAILRVMLARPAGAVAQKASGVKER